MIISKKIKLSMIMGVNASKDKVLSAISSRRKYAFEWKNVLLTVFWYPWLNFMWRHKSKIRQNFSTFKSGEQKIKNELDIQHILNSTRNANILVNILLNKRQQFLLKYQHSRVIYPEDEQNSNISFEKVGFIYPKEKFKNKTIKEDSCNLCP